MSEALRVPALLLLLLLATCGGGSTGPTSPDYGSFPVPGDTTDPGPVPPGSGSTPLPPELAGGVLATFDVGGETFSMWVPDSPTAQILADAWTGAGPAVPAVCADIEPGSGRAGHNAPWSWSVRTSSAILLNGICTGCAFAWDTPSKAEAGMAAGPPYDCAIGQEHSPRPMIMMHVVLIDFRDGR